MLRRTIAITCISLIINAIAAQPLPEIVDAWQGAYAVDMLTGEVLYDYNSSLPMTPASLTKLFTTAAVVERFGADHRITTIASYDSATHDLYIIGHADPTFDSEHYRWHSALAFADAIADTLLSMQIRNIRSVNADISYISEPRLPSARMWVDMGNYFGSVPSALNYRDNTFVLKLNSPDRVGERCTIASVEPPIDETIECYCHAFADRYDSAYIYGLPGAGYYVSGAIPKGRTGFAVKGAMPRPEVEFCRAVKRQLQSRGIVVENDIEIAICPNGATEIARAQSPTIASIIRSTNQRSINLYADALLMQLADGNASWDGCLSRLKQFVRLSTGRDAALCDGCGLSPRNAIATRQFVDLLLYMQKSPNWQTFYNSLAVSGQDGTLRNMAKGTRLFGHIIGKSGTLADALGYAGIIDCDNRKIAFCIIVNKQNSPNNVVREAITQWLLRLTDSNTNANTI